MKTFVGSTAFTVGADYLRQLYVPYLQDLYREIDVYDLKIAHCLVTDTFAVESERISALNALRRQRLHLVKIAMKFAGEGVAFDPKFLPRSFARGADGKLADMEAATE